MKKVIEKTQTLGLSIVLFFIFLLGLFSETVRTLPAGAFSEKTNFYDIAKLLVLLLYIFHFLLLY